MVATRIMFINHASFVVQYQDQYLYCDPWHESPAFGSWLPTFPMFCHPVYLAALKDKMSLLISHGHDDHCDERLLSLFDRDTPIVTSDFVSPSVTGRVGRLGFDNFHLAGREGIELGDFQIWSIRNDSISEDDAIYIIKTPDALIIHCNDNWFPLTDDIAGFIRQRVAQADGRVLYMSQTNSASGYPLNYRNYSLEERRELLRSKVEGMIKVGLQNCATVGAPYFVSYAGFASVFVKDKPEYFDAGIVPSAGYIKTTLAEHIPESVSVLDMYPGDVFDFSSLQSSLLSGYEDEAIKQKSRHYYEIYGQINACDTYAQPLTSSGEAFETRLDYFLRRFDEFVQAKVERHGLADSIVGKSMAFNIEGDGGVSKVLRFGSGLVDPQQQGPANKEMFVSRDMMDKVITGKALFENLYTGYEAEFRRNPADVYNRDIVMAIVMYSYVYINRYVKELP